MSFLERTSAFLVERVAPKLIFGKTDEAALAELERQAREEIEARIRLGRPGPKEARPRFRPPTPAPVPAPRVPVAASRPVGVHTVALAAIGAPAPAAPRPMVEAPLSEHPA